MQIKVIPEKPELYAEIRHVICSAFGHENEAILVENLRMNNRFVPDLSLAAMDNDRILGHILLFPVDIIDGEKGIPHFHWPPFLLRQNTRTRESAAS